MTVAMVNTDLERSTSDLCTSVGKALALLDSFDSMTSALGVTELARRAGIPKSTAFRLLAELETRGYLERVGTRYCLGKRLFELGNLVSYCRPRSLRDVASPYLSELYELSHETVHLGVLDGLHALYVAKLFGHDPVKSPSHVGSRVPLYRSAIGKAMLAFGDEELIARVSRRLEPVTPYTITSASLFRAELETIRNEGIAYDREEARLGLTCVAAPIWQHGQVTAAVSISGQSGRFDATRFASAVRRAAERIGDRR